MVFVLIVYKSVRNITPNNKEWDPLRYLTHHCSSIYSARRLIGSRIIESAAYCNQILLDPLYINSSQNTSVDWIIRVLLSLLGRPKVILLSGGHCSSDFLSSMFSDSTFSSFSLEKSERWLTNDDWYRREEEKKRSNLSEKKLKRVQTRFKRVEEGIKKNWRKVFFSFENYATNCSLDLLQWNFFTFITEDRFSKI